MARSAARTGVSSGLERDENARGNELSTAWMRFRRKARMDQIDTLCFEILNVNIYDETPWELVVHTSTGKIWTSRRSLA